MKEDDIKVPKPESGNLGHALVKGALGQVPFVGSFAAEFFGCYVTPSLNKKQQLWMTSVAQAIVELKKRVEGLNLDSLAESAGFGAAVLTATQAALKTDDQHKLEALRNAVLNVALHPDLQSFEREMYLYLADRLTSFHLQLLQGYVDYFARREELKESMPQASEFPIFSADQELALVASRDLLDCHLLDMPRTLGAQRVDPFWTNDAGQLGMNPVEVTRLGEGFLAFISDPLQ